MVEREATGGGGVAERGKMRVVKESIGISPRMGVLCQYFEMMPLSAETGGGVWSPGGKGGVLPAERPCYRRWVRFYRDFCQKYHHPPSDERTLSRFLRKLAE